MLFRSLNLFRRLFREDAGQDLIEYAILTAIVTAGGVLVFVSIRAKMAGVYVGWGTTIQDNWDPAPPLG